MGSAALALVSTFGFLGSSVLAAGAGSAPVPDPRDGTGSPPGASGAPGAPGASQAVSPPVAEPPAGIASHRSTGEAGPAPAPPAQPSPPAQLFPEEGPAPNVSNVSLTGEAYVVRQDVKAPLEAHLGRYPRATADVSNDLTTAFGAFADPGFLGRFAVGAGAQPTGDRTAASPAWAECVFPKSPLTPSEDVRSPANGAGPTAVARCLPGAAQAAGYYLRDPGPGATGGVALLNAAAAAAARSTVRRLVGRPIVKRVISRSSLNSGFSRRGSALDRPVGRGILRGRP
jgi:hypothetical protein